MPKINIPASQAAPETNLFIEVVRKDCSEQLDQWEREVLFLIPGGPGGNHTLYAQIKDELLKYGDLVIVDLRGCGLSDSCDVDFCSLDQHIHDLETLREKLNIEKPVIHGCSYGALVALGHAVSYPDSLSKLILTSGAASFEFIEKAKQNLTQRGSAKQIEMGNLVWNGSFESPEQFGEYYKTLAPLYIFTHDPNEIPLTVKSSIPHNMELTNRAFTTYLKTFDYRQELEKVKVPTLIFSGQNDWIMDPSEAVILSKGIADSELVIIDKCGHFPWKDKKDAFFKALSRFMRT